MNQTIYISAPVNALVEGLYEQNLSFSEIRKHGDFGIGTFDALDGEMIMLDSIIYRIDHNCEVHIVPDSAATPFACVTFFSPVSYEQIKPALDYQTFLSFLHKMMPSPNVFYAFRIEGLFDHVQTRSVSRQENYLPLVDAAKEQRVYEFRHINGTVCGFYTPPFMSSVNVPGLHLHFLASDMKGGGHLLSCRPEDVRAEIQFLNKMELSLPITLDYLTLDFKRNTGNDLQKAEN